VYSTGYRQDNNKGKKEPDVISHHVCFNVY
jgi:hypothetical protein